VDEDQADQPDAEPEPAEPDVGAERDEQAEQELELENPDAELGQKRPIAANGAQILRPSSRQFVPRG